MKNYTLVIVSVLAFGLSACAMPNGQMQQTQLQERQYQTATFDTSNQNVVMKALVGALQDDGFTITVANTNLGLLSANKQIDVRNNGTAFLAVLLAGSQAVYANNAVIDATANVSPFGKQTRVRVNLVEKVINNKGGVDDVKPVTDAKTYRDLFATVRKSLFIAKEKL